MVRRKDRAPAGEPHPSPADVRTARLLVAGQFVLIALIAILPVRADWPVPRAFVMAGVAGVIAGLAVLVGAARTLGRGLTAVPLPNAHAQLRTNGLY